MEVQEPVDQIPQDAPVENKESTMATEIPNEKNTEQESSEPKLDAVVLEQHAVQITEKITGETLEQRDVVVTEEVPPIAQEGELCCGYTEAQIDVYIDAIFNKFECPPDEMRNPVVQLLNRRRVSALVAGDYDKAEHQDKILQMYNYVLHLEEQKANEDHRIDVLYERWQALQNEQERINTLWDKKMDSYAQEDQARWDEMIKRQEEEVHNFSESWKDPKKLRTFAKPSAKLLQMREQEKNMAVTRMYQKAKDMKAVADALQKKETEAAQQKINQQMALEKRAMEERHEKEKQKHMNHRDTVLNVLEKQRQNDLKPIQNAMQQIRAKKGLVSNPKSATMTTRSVKDIETVSPRTQQLFATFKSAKKTSKLEVKPGEEPKSRTMRRSQTATMKKTNAESPHEEENASTRSKASNTASARSRASNTAPEEEQKNEQEQASARSKASASDAPPPEAPGSAKTRASDTAPQDEAKGSERSKPASARSKASETPLSPKAEQPKEEEEKAEPRLANILDSVLQGNE